MDMSKRFFFTKTLLHKALACVGETTTAFKNGQSEAEYFDSFESAYPMVSECYNFVEDEAEKLGIDTTNKSKLDLVREVYMTRNEGPS